MNLMLSNSPIVGILTILVAILGIAIFVVSIIAVVVRWMLIHKYRKDNNMTLLCGLNNVQAGRTLLDAHGLQDVQIVKSNWFMAQIFGNRYSVKDKKIKLRGNIMDNSSLTAVGVTCQKVAFAAADQAGDKMVKTRAVLAPIIAFGPLTFIPILLIGLIMDILIFSGASFVCTMVCGLLGFVFLVISCVLLGISVKIEKKANAYCMEMLEKSTIMTEEERDYLQDLFNFYILDYVLQFVENILELIRFILQILLAIAKNQDNK